MRIAFLFNYPLADNAPWRQQLIRALRDQHQLMVVFGKTRPIDCLRACFGRRQEDDVPETAQPVAPTEPRKLTVTVLRELRAPVRRVGSLKDPAGGDILTTFRPDYVVTALDHLLGEPTVSAVPIVLKSSAPARPTGGAARPLR